jgi:hypothetical protein
MRHHPIVFPLRRPAPKPRRPFAKRMPIAVAAWTLVLLAMPLSFAQAADDNEQQAVNNAHRFLKTEENGRYTLGYVHFGADYHGHEYRETLPVLDGTGRPIAGRFKLVYSFRLGR